MMLRFNLLCIKLISRILSLPIAVRVNLATQLHLIRNALFFVTAVKLGLIRLTYDENLSLCML